MEKRHNYLRGGLTPKQREYYDFIRDHIHEYGSSPSLQEIANHFNVSVANAHTKVNALVDRGFLTRTEGATRGIDLV